MAVAVVGRVRIPEEVLESAATRWPGEVVALKRARGKGRAPSYEVQWYGETSAANCVVAEETLSPAALRYTHRA